MNNLTLNVAICGDHCELPPQGSWSWLLVSGNSSKFTFPVFHLFSGEPGLLVSEISARAPFTGYARDLQQTEKKRLHDVFKKGDLYFNAGDLLLIDKDNFFYFQDRVGDTFRQVDLLLQSSSLKLHSTTP